jgi:hypothetical protein
MNHHRRVLLPRSARALRPARLPPVGGDVVDLDATFDQWLLNVPIGLIESQIPAHRDDDRLGREP